MKHARKDYNERVQDSANIIPAEEPVFLLRGQDPVAPDVLNHYAMKAREAGASEVLVNQVTCHAKAMREFQTTVCPHVPDMAEEDAVYTVDGKLVDAPAETLEEAPGEEVPEETEDEEDNDL